MKLQYLSITLIMAVAACSTFSEARAKGKFQLAEGARGKVCLTCHEDFKEKLDKASVHSPLRQGNCTGCHSPHVSDHGKLLAGEESGICQTCHAEIVPENAASAHEVVLEGNCTLCHDPHASTNRMNLLEAGSTLCFGCHAELGEEISTNTVGHAPVGQNCMTCHDPHASMENPRLLKDEAPGLCLDCHDAQKSTFRTVHMQYPVETSNCSSCHNPHGSNNKSILYDVVHEPVSKRMCKQCHEEPSSATPFAVTKKSFELCQGCHYDMMNDTFNKDRMHWPVVDGTGCGNCHAPHGSSESKLLKEPMLELCGSCHADTISRQERAATKHQPISDGECSACHFAHSSDNEFILKKDSTVELCADCHEWQTHSTHPIGEEVIDPRNRNLDLDCLSCHRTHGTEYKHFIYYETINDQCVQCHSKYRR